MISWSRHQLLAALTTFLYGAHVTKAISLDPSSTDSIKNAASTVAYDMMSYYKGNESGMPEGLLPDPYYWWEAGAMFGQMIEYWFYTGDDSYNEVVTNGLLAQIGPQNDFMPPNQTKTEGNDDQAFWAFAAMSAAEMNFPEPPPKQPSWLALAQAVFNLQTSRWDTTFCGGGLRWQIFAFNKGYDYKNTISNGGFFQLAARLARYTGNETYAEWAVKSWDWLQNSVVFTDDYQIYDGAQMANNCTIPSKYQWTYNVGTLLMGAANMYNYTNGDPVWQKRVAGLLKGTDTFFPSRDIMVEVACEPQGTCNNDQPSFKAYLARWMAATAQIAPFTEVEIMTKLRASAIGAAQQCSGGPKFRTCGRHWTQPTWDQKEGPGEQMSALSVIQANLIQKVAPPVTAAKGGTSKGNPNAGTQGDNPNPLDPSLTKKITMADRAGAVDRFVNGQREERGKTHPHPLTITFYIQTLSGLLGNSPKSTRSHLQQALFPSGNKAQTFITSLHKKRKLSRQDTPESPVLAFTSMLDGSSAPSSQKTQPSSPIPHLLVPDFKSSLTSSPSPPRFIPPHMILEGARNGRSPTPELTGMAASSPSAAYSRLTLDGESSGDTSGQDERRTKDAVNIRDVERHTALSNRSSSPAAKRTASEMDETPPNNQDADVPMDQQVEVAPEPMSETLGSSSSKKSQNHGTQHRREITVDTLAYEASPSLEHEPCSEDKVSLLGGAYQTPRSEFSSTASSIGPHEASGASSTSSATSSEIPSVDEQIEQVMQLAHKPMQAGQKGFIISKKWLSRVLSRGSSAEVGEKFAKEAREGVIGPVDNTGLSLEVDPSAGNFRDEAGEPYVPLRPGLQMSEDFEILPQEAWDLTIKWYGLAKGSTVVTRYCHNTSTSETQENLQFELHPPIFTVLKLPDTSEGLTTKVLQEKEARPIRVLASRHERYQSFLKRVKSLANIELKKKVRIWRILGGLGGGAQASMITPAQSRSNSPAPNFIAPVDPGNHLVMDVISFADLQLGSQRELIEANDETANEKYNGHSTLDLIGLRQDEVIVVEEQIGGPAGGEWVSDAVRRQAKANGIAISVTKNGSTAVQETLKPRAKVGSGRTSPAPTGMMTRGRQQKNGRARGTAGLNNLGNTCYMNSALQCIRSVEELTKYFLLDKYKKDLNPNNPLSHNGQVAKAYANLVNEMFSQNVPHSFAPRNFKNIIGKYGPSFSGYQQQDSQEFLLFLLDGLQEDLSRVHKKPYIEKPDSTDEMVNDPVALRAMADKCWDIYQARNDSVITDLFAGMYKSTVVCPVCDKVSIIFDPFNNLTLQLPIENVWVKPIFYFPMYSRPIRVMVDIDKNASFMALKEFVAGRVGADPKRTVVAEIYKHRIYKMFDDKKSIIDERIADNDTIGVFELEHQPSNYPPPKKKVQKFKAMGGYFNHSDEEEDVPEGESPLADKMLVAVFNREIKEGGSRYQQRTIFGAPSYIVVTRDEAKDYDAILRKVLVKVDTMTTRDFLKDDAGSGNESTPEDSDCVLMNTDDGDSWSESKVQAQSLESEDEMVDISMRDAGNEPQAHDGASNPLPGMKHTRLPLMLQPGEFITPEVRNLFEMKYFSSSNEMIPTGWSTLQDENRDYPTLQSRRPAVEAGRRRDAKSKLTRRLQRLGSASSSDADDDAEAPYSIPETKYESDSDGLPPVEEVTQPPIGFQRFDKNTRRNSKGLITYSRKGKNVAHDENYNDSESDANDSPLIRLGEAIVLDWTADACDYLFVPTEGRTESDVGGTPTWDSVPDFPDPELEERQRLRNSRKRNGISLEDCLDEFGKAEILSENDAWYCPRCKEHRRASKTFELWKAPDILVIHLKRFSAQGRNLRDKLDVLVDFPVEGLDLTSRVAMQEDGKSPLYDLFAVDNHYGGLGGGHYTACAQNFYDKTWYDYNDSSVSPRSNPDVVVTAAAYLLFYRRRATHPLGGPFFEQIINAAHNPTPQSQPASRTASPAGEGKRLDSSSSHNGLSSALAGAGATHQAEGGGLAVVTTVARTRTGVDDDLPSYSSSMENTADHPRETLESMDMTDEDEAIGDIANPFPSGLFHSNSWTFANLPPSDDRASMNHRIAAPPGSDQEGEEDLFDEDSNKAVSPSSDSDRRLPSFVEDEGTTSGAFGSYRSGSTPVQDVPPPMEEYDGPVAEVRLAEGEMFNLD